VPIYTLYVGPAGGEESVGAVHLARLAGETGGQRLTFAAGASLDPIFQRLVEHGRQYRLSYRSGLSATGQHTLAGTVSLPTGETLPVGEAVFPLRLEPPVVSLAGLPADVVRVAPSAEADPAAADPVELSVPLTLDFPDGHPRALRLAELLVDGQVVATSTEPSGALTWPLAGYAPGATYSLQARVIDELGLAAESQAVTVSISLQVPAAPAGPLAALPARVSVPSTWPLLGLALLGIGLAVGVGAVAWLAVARRQQQGLAGGEAAVALPAEAALAAEPEPAPARANPWSARTRRVAKPVRRPPAAAESEAEAPAAPPRARPHVSLPHVSLPQVSMPAVSLPPMGRLGWRRAPQTPPARPSRAYLELLTQLGGQDDCPPVIELNSDTITLGRDGTQAQAVLAEGSVSPRHARIVAENGSFRVFDEGSTAGTWVNYALISAESGQLLEPDDLINLGRVQLRFRPPAAPAGSAPGPKANGHHQPRIVRVDGDGAHERGAGA
jgi:hypothetical protein